jgi:hypothetical protein
VREGVVKGTNTNYRITAAKILIDKVYPSGGEKNTDKNGTLKIEIVDLSK